MYHFAFTCVCMYTCICARAHASVRMCVRVHDGVLQGVVKKAICFCLRWFFIMTNRREPHLEIQRLLPCAPADSTSAALSTLI